MPASGVYGVILIFVFVFFLASLTAIIIAALPALTVGVVLDNPSFRLFLIANLLLLKLSVFLLAHGLEGLLQCLGVVHVVLNLRRVVGVRVRHLYSNRCKFHFLSLQSISADFDIALVIKCNATMLILRLNAL